MFERKDEMIMTGSNVVKHGRLKRIRRERTPEKRPRVIVLMKSLGLSQKDAPSWSKWRRRIKEATG